MTSKTMTFRVLKNGRWKKYSRRNEGCSAGFYDHKIVEIDGKLGKRIRGYSKEKKKLWIDRDCDRIHDFQFFFLLKSKKRFEQHRFEVERKLRTWGVIQIHMWPLNEQRKLLDLCRRYRVNEDDFSDLKKKVYFHMSRKLSLCVGRDVGRIIDMLKKQVPKNFEVVSEIDDPDVRRGFMKFFNIPQHHRRSRKKQTSVTARKRKVLTVPPPPQPVRTVIPSTTTTTTTKTIFVPPPLLTSVYTPNVVPIRSPQLLSSSQFVSRFCSSSSQIPPLPLPIFNVPKKKVESQEVSSDRLPPRVGQISPPPLPAPSDYSSSVLLLQKGDQERRRRRRSDVESGLEKILLEQESEATESFEESCRQLEILQTRKEEIEELKKKKRKKFEMEKMKMEEEKKKLITQISFEEKKKEEDQKKMEEVKLYKEKFLMIGNKGKGGVKRKHHHREDDQDFDDDYEPPKKKRKL